jgi:MFS family permease
METLLFTRSVFAEKYRVARGKVSAGALSSRWPVYGYADDATTGSRISMSKGTFQPTADRWYRAVTPYQWMVLAIASAGWVFDVFEGQIIVSVKNPMLAAIVPGDRDRAEALFDAGIATFLVGGTLGGVLFGMLADRWGRVRVMGLTILMYSVFTGLTALVQEGWQLVALRFLVGMGVGGEWSVATATVAETFPQQARARAAGIFHASSVLGTFLAVGAAFLVLSLEGGWRVAFLLGVLPALLVAWIRISMREPESWQGARRLAQHDTKQQLGSLADLFATPLLRKRTLLGAGLAIIGLATFWGVHIRGRELLGNAVAAEQHALPEELRTPNLAETYSLYGMFLATAGGGLGLLSFAPLSQRIGRRPAFAIMHVAAFATVALIYVLADSTVGLIMALPLFGFCTLGMHAGYAVYFPELYPTRLRATGAGFCFNAGRVIAGPVLLGFRFLRDPLGLPLAMVALAGLYLLALVLLVFAPETRDRPLPE